MVSDAGVVYGTPKSTAGVRDVAIPPHLLPVLREHLDEHVAPEPDALLFPAPDGRNLGSSTMYWYFWPARAAAGGPDLRFHDLRHAGAVLAASTGATLAELMARLGHSTPAAAMKYQHAAADRDRVIADALSQLVVMSRRRTGPGDVPNVRRRGQGHDGGMTKRRRTSTLKALV